MASALLAAQEGMAQIIGGLEGAGVSIIVERIQMLIPFHTGEHAAAQAGRRATPAFHNNPILRELVSEIDASRLAYFFQNHRLWLQVYVYEPGEARVPAAELEYPMDVWSMPRLNDHAVERQSRVQARRMAVTREAHDENMLNASLPLDSIRDLRRSFGTLDQPTRYRFVVSTHTESGSNVEIARSPVVDLGDASQSETEHDGAFVACDVDGAGFEILHMAGRHRTARELEAVSWVIPERLFLSTVLVRLARLERGEARPPGSNGAPGLPETIVIAD